MVMKIVAIIFLSTYLYLYTEMNIYIYIYLYTCKIEENIKGINGVVGRIESEYIREINARYRENIEIR